MLRNPHGPRKPSAIYSAAPFSKDCRGKQNRENNIHGKAACTSFLPRSSQIIGSDEESIENSEFSWEKNFKQLSKGSQNTCGRSTSHAHQHPWKLSWCLKKRLSLATYGNIYGTHMEHTCIVILRFHYLTNINTYNVPDFSTFF